MKRRQDLRWVITTPEAQPYTYYGASTAWRRAVKRAGVHNCHFHDLRSKALTDKEASEGMQQALAVWAGTAPSRRRPTTCSTGRRNEHRRRSERP